MAGAIQEKIIIDEQRNLNDNLLESEEFLASQGKITVPFGVTERGTIITKDLSSIPHILVCGFTGSGKTAFVQTVLSVLLSRQSPNDVKTIIYDSKRVGYNLFANVPHLLMPIINEQEKALSVIKYLSDESRRRFNLFANVGSRDYERYNSLQSDATKRIPELFVILDDFATLSLDKNALNDLLDVLNNGRIAGIHVVIVSSLTTTKILKRELISSIPCKICFRVSSKTESKNVLEHGGAEELYVPGEMIYRFQNDICKCQSAYATYENIESVMNSVRQSAVSVTSIGIEASMLFSDIPTTGFFEHTNTSYDSLITNAAEAIINSNKASASTIQRSLGIGYNRAAIIMDQLESLGVISAVSASRPREVLMGVDQWNQMCQSNGLDKISKTADLQTFTPDRATYKTEEDKKKSPVKAEQNDEPNVKLRDFPEIDVNGVKISVHNHEIHYTKKVMTKIGIMGTMTPTFSGDKVTSLVYKKPSVFSPGYMTFEFDPSVEINIERPQLVDARKSNISNLLKIEFRANHDKVIRLLLQQLSEDIGVPIKCI